MSASGVARWMGWGIGFAILFALALAPLHAQNLDNSPQPGDAQLDATGVSAKSLQRRLDFLTDKLGLTSEQQSLVLTFLRTEADTEIAAHNHQKLSEDRSAARKIRLQTRMKISDILTPDQREIFSRLKNKQWLPS